MSTGEELEEFDDNIQMDAFVLDEPADTSGDADENENIDKAGESEKTEEVTGGVEIKDDEDKPSKDSTSGDGEDDTSPGDKLYSSLADNMRERGILSSLDPEKLKDIKDVDSLMDAFNDELQKREFGDLDDKQKAYLKAIREGIPEEEVTDYIKVSDQLDKISDNDISENEALRKELIKQQYIVVNNMTEAKAERLAQTAIDTGEDVEDATEALQSLRQYEQVSFQQKLEAKEKEKELAKKRTEDAIQNFKQKIDNSKEIFKGMELSKTDKEKLFNQMTRPVSISETGKPIDAITKARMENPEEFTLRLNYLFMQTNGFKDIDKFIKKSKSEAAAKLDSLLKSQKGDSLGTSGKGNFAGGTDFESLGDIL